MHTSKALYFSSVVFIKCIKYNLNGQDTSAYVAKNRITQMTLFFGINLRNISQDSMKIISLTPVPGFSEVHRRTQKRMCNQLNIILF